MPAPDLPTGGPVSLRWARLRFAIVGPLLASPAEPGELASRLAELAARPYQHPTTGETVRFSFKTIERWYYTARNQADPVGALARKVPKHAGTHPSVSAELAAAIRAQYRDHPRWSYQLHHDNLVALGQAGSELGPVPGYATLCRFMKHEGLLRQRRRRRRGELGRERRETRSFEVEHVHALWHLDFHEGSRKVTTPTGELRSVQLLGVLDDHSRLCCHLQWYFSETAEALCHGLSQAIQKRGLPRALLTDNGAAMLAAETREGLERLGVVHYTTLPETPEQNGKQETFWRQVEGRLMPMLEGEPELTLTLLNTATQAWVERDYHRRRHEELGESPLQRYLGASSVGRTSPDSEALRRAFRTEIQRTQRRSDGTTTVAGVRFEVPSTYRTLGTLTLRVARWDLSSVHLVDPRSGALLATLLPLDRARNANRKRRAIPDGRAPKDAPNRPVGMAPLLRQLMADYAATGLPPGYLPKDDETTTGDLGQALDRDEDHDEQTGGDDE